MADHEMCKEQRRVCRDLFTKDVKRLEERFNYTDQALVIQQAEIKRRMHEANDIKKEFTQQMVDLQLQVGTLETRSALWLRFIGFGLALLQIIIAVILKVTIK